MQRKQIEKKYDEILSSSRISKFEELVSLFSEGLGDIIYEDLKLGKDGLLNRLNMLGIACPRETFYVWQHLYNCLTEKEYKNDNRIALGTLYFWMGNSLYHQNKSGFGKYYLKAYVEDIGLHTDYLTGGAIQALRVYCYLGQKGISLLDKMLQQSTKTTNIIELRDHLKNISRSEFERLVVEIENIFSLEGNEFFFLPVMALKSIVTKIDPLIQKKENKKQAKLLEQLCQLLFGSINGFRYKLDERSTLFQLDGLIRNTSDHNFLNELGSTITVEAKQYFKEKKIGRPIIDILAMNMARVGASSSFLVTSASLSKPAEDEIYHTYLRQGTFIIPLFFKEIKELCEEKISFPVLISTKVSNIKTKRKL
jgi:hypothetical protein